MSKKISDEEVLAYIKKESPHIIEDALEDKQEKIAEQKRKLAWAKKQEKLIWLCKILKDAKIINAEIINAGSNGDYEDYNPPTIKIVTDKGTLMADEPEMTFKKRSDKPIGGF